VNHKLLTHAITATAYKLQGKLSSQTFSLAVAVYIH